MKYTSILATGIILLMSINSSYAQKCNNNMIQSAPDSRFEDLNNGTVKDTQTGLIWQRCSIGETWVNGQCSGEAKKLTWHEALTEAKKYGDGWRLPNIKEFNSILEFSCTEPMLNSKQIPINYKRFDMLYWSSTPSKSKVEEPRFGIVQENNIVTLDLGNGSLALAEPIAEFKGLAVKSPK